MKKLLYILTIISFGLNSCGGGGGGGDNPTPTPTPTPTANKPPTTPALVAPTNNKLCIDNQVVFQWNTATDPDGDTVKYQLQIAKDNQFTQIENSVNETTTSTSIALDKGIAYYWRVKAIDSKNLSGSYSGTFNFYTEGTGEINHAPFSPELVSPELNAVIQTTTTTLTWTGSDPDTSDVLTYDVYFDMVNPPVTKVGDNQSANALDVTLTSSQNYYWEVVVKDGKGGETIGQIWNFKTD